ncbi:MAG: hypothetical protein Q4A16_09945 [Lautropia sp.]|nr:hypothetical protein [Lautropia sp.]
MLDQRVITGPHGPGASAAAFAAPATGTHGAIIADPAAPNLLIGSGLNIDNYRYPSPNWQGLTNYDPGVYQPAVGDFVRFDSQDVLNLRGMVQTGTLPFTPVTTQIEISASSTAMSLDDEITARVGTGADTLTLELDAAAKRIIANQTMLHYGEIIQQWRNDDHVVQLILRKDGNNPATPALCWNYRLPGVGRLSCHVWEVPTDWQVGAPLNYKGHYVDDDRSHHAGESGHLYWRFAR